MTLDFFLDGKVCFDRDEELLRFRYRLLTGVMLTSAVGSAIFLVLSIAGINSLVWAHLCVIAAYCVFSAASIVLMRGHKKRFQAISRIFVAATFLVFASALFLVVNDELRVIWFYLLVFFTFVTLGQAAGIFTAVVSASIILLAGFYFSVPMSGNAVTTLLISLGATTLVSYVFAGRTTSYFKHMLRARDELETLANKDPLTGLLNARAYYDIANRLIQIHQRNADSFSVLFIDVDHFKRVNDSYGHEIGDKVLLAIAACLNAWIRGSDILARIGGEEFSLFLPNTNLEGAITIAEMLRMEIEMLKPTVNGFEPLEITVSIGVAEATANDVAIRDIQYRADQAMYLAKGQGRNRVISVCAAEANLQQLHRQQYSQQSWAA